ncbi:PAS domain-containing sensor histidine kinase [Paracidovorax konjaci]|uniref:histidine kinase n=1 Tax=Paracidovorax konjaci TaxID=32040 RepID=A0A1I1U2M3_9BURK|nr:PAS domain-containing sensor histidine kinase [Paracidovorax konjaci]SFD63868.1 PAS domain S-box-containing protein [Paracidovorax konjaci]
MAQHRAEHGTWHEEDAAALNLLFMEKVRQYAVVFMDPEGCITGWTEGCHAITGFTAQEVIGKSITVLFTPEDVERGLHMHELNTARLLGAAEDERWHVRKDGSRFWGSGMTFPLVPGPQPRGFAKLFRDATHLRLRMDALESEVRQLTQDRHDRNVFLATIAHELRNPLQPMSIATALLSHPSQQARHEQALKIIHRQLGFIERLVEDLIDMTRITQGRMAIVYGRVELQALVQEAVDSMRHAAMVKDINLRCVLPPVPVRVEADAGRLTQVLMNLLNNAVKFTPKGGEVSVSVNVDQTHFIVKVQDTGQGIGPELQPKIFDMFTQAEPSGTARGQGLGIGLALVKQIVSLHRGTVEVKSEGIGKGSEFFVRIPLEEPEPAGEHSG